MAFRGLEDTICILAKCWHAFLTLLLIDFKVIEKILLIFGNLSRVQCLSY